MPRCAAETVDTLVIGAGIAGLSLGYFLSGSDFLVLEKEPGAGGCLKQVRRDKFSFDVGVKCIHDRYPEVRSFVEHILGAQNVDRGRLRSGFLFRGMLHDLPFELNMAALRPVERLSCLSSYLVGRSRRVQRRSSGRVRSFRDYGLSSYGDIAERFLIPYAEKTWAVPAGEIDHVGALAKVVPPPGFGAFARSAFACPGQDAGQPYLYPHRGMQELTDRLSLALGERLRLGCEVISVDVEGKLVTLKSGEVLGTAPWSRRRRSRNSCG